MFWSNKEGLGWRSISPFSTLIDRPS